MINFLMIDDNPIEHLIMQKMLNKFHLFPVASHSLDARLSMDLFERSYLTPDLLPDVVFLDLNMPGFSGWDFLDSFERIYKRIKKTIDIYIISSSIDPKDRLLPEKYAFVKACLCKPVKMETLLNLHSLYQSIKRDAG
ncbi:response regulator [Mucilaginibacter sp.]|uniref:response regulator n=1 Tax=Mucilaginibacter sp. TaxID=1882438 RepID=UPI0026384A6A|nr:response regulator [Mucilaginibacter sp.]